MGTDSGGSDGTAADAPQAHPGGPSTPAVEGDLEDLDAVRSRISHRDPVVVAWVFIVVASGVASLLLSYATIQSGARVLFYASLVELAWSVPEERAHDRNAEQFVFVGVSLVAICLGLLFEGLFALASLDLGAAQLLALAGVTSRVYVNYTYDGTLGAAIRDVEPVTYPFLTVAALTTFGLGFIARVLAAASGGAIPAPNSAAAFFPLVFLGATAGLAAYVVDEEVLRRGRSAVERTREQVAKRRGS